MIMRREDGRNIRRKKKASVYDKLFRVLLPRHSTKKEQAPLLCSLVSSLDSGSLCLFLGNTLGDEGVVLCLLLLLVLDTAALERAQVTAALKTEGSDETLDFGTAKA